MGWKSTVDITREQAKELISKRLIDISNLSNEELANVVEGLGYGDDPELSYYGSNFNVVDIIGKKKKKMKEQIVEFETAKLAKTLGFDWEVEYFFDYDQKILSLNYPQANIFDFNENENIEYVSQKDNWNKFNFSEDRLLGFEWSNVGTIGEYFTIFCSAPTQALLQKWLRDEYNIFVTIRLYKKAFRKDFKYGYCIQNDSNGEYYWVDGLYIKTYREALKEGLQRALKSIKNKN